MKTIMFSWSHTRGVLARAAVFVGLAGSLLSFETGAEAHVGATGIVKERMDVMASMGRSMKTLSDIFRRKTSYDSAVIVSRSREISAHSRTLAKLFPENSIQGPSEATAAIWQNWNEFLHLADRLASESTDLAAIAQKSSVWHANRQFTRIIQLCTECHTRFRAASKSVASK